METAVNSHFPGDVFLLLSGACNELELLRSKSLLEEVLSRLPPMIGMNAISLPVVTTANDNPGLEGYIAIDTSNITVSTYVESPRIVICVHSCKPFDGDKIRTFLTAAYKCESFKWRWVHESELGQHE